MLDSAEIEELRGRHLVGSDGSTIGKIDAIHVDEASGRPRWAVVTTGLLGLKSSFVPITGAEVIDGEVAVPFDKATVKDAPKIDPDGAPSPEEEATLLAHYGRDDEAYGGSAGAAVGTAPGGSDPAPPGDAAAAGPASTATDGAVDGVAGPSASLAAARVAREDESGLGSFDAEGAHVNAGRTQEELDAERRGPQGETGRSDTEDPVPPDGGPPPRNDHDQAPPAGAPDGHEAPSAVEEGVPKPPGAPPETHDHLGEHWEDEALPERGNATATPERGL